MLILYEGYFLPLAGIVQELNPSNTRQIATEIRNCHTHLYWGARDPETIAEETKKAFDHLLRAVVDEYKIAIDALLSRIPPSGPAEALVHKIAAEGILDEIWDSQAREHWENRFENWCQALEQAVDAARCVYRELPENLVTLKKIIGSFSVSPESLTEAAELLPEVVCEYGRLAVAENRYRLVLKQRIDGHVQEHLTLFDWLIRVLWGNSDIADYNEKVAEISIKNEDILFSYESNTAHILLLQAKEKEPDWYAKWHAKLLAISEMVESPSGELLEKLYEVKKGIVKTIVFKDSAPKPKAEWQSTGEIYSYENFERMITALFSDLKTHQNVLAKLYAAYQLMHRANEANALWAIVSKIRSHFEERSLGDIKVADMLDGAELNTFTAFCDDLLRRSTLCLVDHDKRDHISVADRAVWFFDIANSSSGGVSSSQKRKLYEFAMALFTKTPSKSPIVVNTWGDAMIAIHSDPLSSIEAAVDILDYAKEEQIGLRFGAAYGSIDLQVNAILGLDAFGETVETAARFEPMAEEGEILLTKEFRSQLPDNKKYSFTTVDRKLKKKWGDQKAKTKISCIALKVK